jgi:hypothetical protein
MGPQKFALAKKCEKVSWREFLWPYGSSVQLPTIVVKLTEYNGANLEQEMYYIVETKPLPCLLLLEENDMVAICHIIIWNCHAGRHTGQLRTII